jgi:hypothetical protein
MAEFLKQGERRVDNARAWAVGAADLLLDCLDDLVTVPRLLGDEMENDQAKITMGEEATEAGSAAVTVPSMFELRIVVAVPPVGKPLVVVLGRMSMVHE